MHKTGQDEISDEELVDQIVDQGRSHLFQYLYLRYEKKVYYQVVSYLKDQDEAKDLTQEIFIKVFDKLSQFQKKSSFSTWLYSGSRFSILDFLRIQQRVKEDSLENHPVESWPEIDQSELFQIKGEQMMQILEDIHPEEKSLLIMMYAYEWKMDDISEFMGISLSAVKMRLKRTKKKVVDLFEERFDIESEH